MPACSPSCVAAAALLVCMGLGMGPLVAVVVVVLSFVTTIMSAQSVGQTGIDPMEIFGLIVLLAVAAFANVSQVQLFYVAGVVAVACGLAGDVMSDFKTGAIIGSSPRAMWVGQSIGALLGTVVAVAVLCTLVSAYGTGRLWPWADVRLHAGERRGHDGLRGPERARVCDRARGRRGALLRGPARDDVWPGRLPAVLHVLHRGARRPPEVGLRPRGRARRKRVRGRGGARGSWWPPACSAASPSWAW